MSGRKKVHRQVNIAFASPGQAQEGTDISTLGEHDTGKGIITSLEDTLRTSLIELLGRAEGEELASAALVAEPEVMKHDTRVAQVNSMFRWQAVWLTLLNLSVEKSPEDRQKWHGKAWPMVKELIGDGWVRPLMLGHSAGFNNVAFSPGIGNLEDALHRSGLGFKSAAVRGGHMRETPHDYNIGGMSAVVGLPATRFRLSTVTVSGLCRDVNEKLGQKSAVEIVNFNAPLVNIVGGLSEALDMLNGLVTEKGGRFTREVSPYIFHYPMIMAFPGKKFGLYISAAENLGTVPAELEFGSYVKGKIILHKELPTDLTEGVWKPVRWFTRHGHSVHGALRKYEFLYLVTSSRPMQSWMRDSKHVETAYIKNLGALAAIIVNINKMVLGEMQPGKQLVAEPVPPQAPPKLVYQA